MVNETQLADEFIWKAMTANTIIYTVALTLGLFGNITVFYIYVTKVPRERFKPRYFVPVLSFFDILVCVVSLIYFTVQTFRWISFYSEELCKLMVCLVIFTMMTSDAFLLAIAIQRYRTICIPFGKSMSLKWRRISVVSVVIAGLLYSIPSIFVAGVSDFVIEYKGVNISGQSCYNGNKKYPQLQVIYHIILNIIGTANIVLTAGMYAPIAVIIIRRHRRKLSIEKRQNMSMENTSGSNANFNMNPSSTAITKDKSEKVNFNMMFFIIILVYVVSYIPTAIVNTTISLTDDFYRNLSTTEYGISDFFVKFYVFNHVANPFIYAYFDVIFRNYLKIFFRFSK